ncbi:hypothetical protein BH11BAC2_BH11BAC2_15310 [soil metagenome]
MARQKPTRKEKFSAVPNRETVVAKVNPYQQFKWMAWVIPVLAFVLYAATFGYSYTLDDYSIILENKLTMKGFAGIGEILRTSYRHGYIFTADELYRPVTKIILAIQWGLSPKNPALGHILNVLLYAVTGWTLYHLLLEWFKGKVMIPFIATILFIVLPIHTEVVSNIKSLDEILGLLFGLLALRSSFHYAQNGKCSNLIKTAIWFLLSISSKESSLTLIALMPLAVWYFTEEKDKQRIFLPMGVSLGVGLIFIMIRAKILGPLAFSLTPSVVDNALMAAPDFMGKFASAIYYLGLYLQAMLFPINLSFDNSYPQLPILKVGDLRFVISLMLLLALFSMALKGFKKKEPWSFALLMFFITASISCNIFVTIGTHWGERLMYTPSLGIVLAIAVLLNRYVAKEEHSNSGLKSSQKTALAIVAGMAVIYGGMTLARESVWKNNGTLYASGLISAPNSSRVQYYNGNHLVKDEQLGGKTTQEKDSMLKASIVFLKRSTALYPPFTDAWNQMGLAYYKLNDLPESIQCYREAMKGNPNDATVHNNLGTSLFLMQQYSEAMSEFQSAVRLNPNYADAWNNIGSTYGTMNDFDAAITAFEKAVASDPMNAQAYLFLGMTWRYKGNEMLANKFTEEAYKLNPALRK